MTAPRRPSPIADELATFFASGEADQGLSSSWEPLAAICQGGFGGSPDPERRVTDRRFRVIGSTDVTRARATRTALLSLSQDEQCALFAAHGPVLWGRVIDAAFGKGMAITVTRRLGDLAGVALLTPTVREGWAVEMAASAVPLDEGRPVEVRSERGGCDGGGRLMAWRRGRVERPQKREAWATAGGWLVALCLDKSEAGKRRAERVKREATGLLRYAEEAYGEARGLAPSPPPRQRIRSFVAPPVSLGEGGDS